MLGTEILANSIQKTVLEDGTVLEDALGVGSHGSLVTLMADEGYVEIATKTGRQLAADPGTQCSSVPGESSPDQTRVRRKRETGVTPIRLGSTTDMVGIGRCSWA